ncbi:hypothetical protein BU25DRAFT_410037 [Macroventuria anomochaeta]|uniref:Uncharacterized protein n=1 Tax=Macroventuria anomochaeta TaxID=301207 RepID=A0ACB6S2K1_9PLEO|nr:uncharacterized protein BU25DRAFT_410037 [Macroventuria anomochaeta]KAF2628470.1 hypothetical protein BU25DRAFT_410037 [Macroventuria anomochaeta]
MPSSNPKATPELRYPPVQADRSLTSLDLDTLMMKSTTRRLPEQPGSSLDDTTYEILTDSLIETSDDEAHTESIASTSDAPTPDDVSAFSDDDDFENDDRALDRSIQSMHAAATDNDLETPLATDGEDSMLTMVPDHMDGSGGSSMLQLDEEPAENAEASLGTTVIKAFPTQTEGLPPVLESYGQTQVRVVVKAALSPRYIPTPESYKILYVGLPEKWVQDSITVHVHAALAASPSNTRSVMVRGQMEPLGPVIHAHRCAHFEIHNPDATLPNILVRMDDGMRLRIDGRKAPRFDLVIFCHTQKRESATDTQTYDPLRTALRQHQIPMIELSEIKPYGAGAHTYDMRSLAACLEGRNDDNADFELLEVLPLDAFTFCELEPFQVNRHLALISPHLVPSVVEVAPKTRLSAMADTIRGIGKQLRTGAPATTKVLLLSIALTAMLSAFVLSPVYMPLVQQKSTDIAADPSTLSVVPVSSPLITPAAASSSSIASVPSPSSFSLSVPKGLTVVHPQAEQPKPKQEKKNKKDEKLNGFDIQTAGEKQFILTPSKGLASSRKKPQLQIQVFRNTTLIPVRYVRTITGEYFVDLKDEYPFGIFNVSIASYSKPLLRQSFEVNLGHNKTWFDQMLGTTTNKIIDAQSLFTDISVLAMEQLQAKVKDIAGPMVSQWIEEGRQLEQAAYRSTKDGLDSGAEFIKHVPEATWMGLRKATAPVRLSETMWKARVNALRVRCNAETVVGRLLKLSNEQPSRACSESQSHAQ